MVTGATAKQVAMVWARVAKLDDNYVMKCKEYEVNGSRPRVDQVGLGERFGKGLSNTQIEQRGAMDRSKWRKLIKDV